MAKKKTEIYTDSTKMLELERQVVSKYVSDVRAEAGKAVKEASGHISKGMVVLKSFAQRHDINIAECSLSGNGDFLRVHIDFQLGEAWEKKARLRAIKEFLKCH